MFADSHCHLNYKGLGEQQPEILARARARGVEAMLNIATRESEWDAVLATAEREPDVWATVGIHPHEADQHPDVGTARLIERAQHPRVVGIGESGLDYFYDHSDRDRQQASFRAHLAACRATQLPIVVHTRDAEADTAQILREEMEQGAYPGSSIVSPPAAHSPTSRSTLGSTYRSRASSPSRMRGSFRKPLHDYHWSVC